MLRLAFRNILRNKRRTVLTMLSMLGGYVLLVLSLSVQNGSYEQVIDFFTKDSTGHAQISEVGYQQRATLYKAVPASDAFYQQLTSLPLVSAAAPRIKSGALAYGETKSFPVQVVGVDAQKEAGLSFLAEKIKQGRYFNAQPNSDGYFEVMVGAAVARQLQVALGDELVLISQGADGSLANDLFSIVGLIGSTESLDARTVYLPLLAAQNFFAMPGEAHYWVVLAGNYRQSDELTAQLNQWLADRPELEAASWKVVSEEFYKTMQADIEGGYIFYYIIIFLVCIGVLNTVLMSVLERTGEFGVLKAIGTSPSRLFFLIIQETLLLAGLSCLFGLLAALPLNYWLASTGFALPEPMEISGVVMAHMKGQWDLAVFVEPALIVIGSVALIAVFPALKAARIVPVDAMRGL
ncbi:ABC transporter permease [Reinekea marinisedimentorum]|nr:ABC transporter permease [Reinekea marinisedimentorum]